MNFLSFGFPLALLILYHLAYCLSFGPAPCIISHRLRSPRHVHLNPSFDPLEVETTSMDSLRPVLAGDVGVFTSILRNISNHLDSQPAVALSVVSTNLQWLFERNLPKLANVMLQDNPEYREDDGLMRSYSLIIDFLETIGEETSGMMQRNQNLLRIILEAAKLSDEKVEEVFLLNKSNFTQPEFLSYLDSELTAQKEHSKLHSLLTVVKLRVLNEMGKEFGTEILDLPKIASIQDPLEMTKQATQYVDSLSRSGCQHIVETLQVVIPEMEKNYDQIDLVLLENLKEIANISRRSLATKPVQWLLS